MRRKNQSYSRSHRAAFLFSAVERDSLRIQKTSRGGCEGGAKTGGCDESHPPGIRGLEVILHTELHIARPNSITQTGDLPEVGRSEGKPRGIAEHWRIGDIRGFKTDLDPLAFPGRDALE